MSTALFHRATRLPAVLGAPLLLALLLAGAPAQASLLYGANAFVEAIVEGQARQRVWLADPDPEPARTASNQVHAGREIFLSGPDLFGGLLAAQAVASSDASGSGLRAGANSSQQTVDWSPFQSATSNGRASTFMNFSTTVLGTPGSSGTLTLRTRAGAGSSPAPFGGSARFSRASFSAGVGMSALAPGASRCRPGVSCADSENFSVLLFDGDALTGLVDLQWELQITVQAGDVLLVTMSAGADVNNGYSAYAWVGGPWDGIPPVAATTARQSFAEATANPASDTGALASLWLSPGLELEATQGLVRLHDGSYGFAAPVPEPATALSLAGGLLWLGWRFRRCVPRAS